MKDIWNLKNNEIPVLLFYSGCKYSEIIAKHKIVDDDKKIHGLLISIDCYGKQGELHLFPTEYKCIGDINFSIKNEDYIQWSLWSKLIPKTNFNEINKMFDELG